MLHVLRHLLQRRGRLLYQLKNEHRPMFAYYDDSRIIGYYSLALQDNNECELNNLCVLPQYRHKHIEARLLEDAYIKAKELGCKKMSIGIVEENTILRKWYEDNGFIHNQSLVCPNNTSHINTQESSCAS